MKFKSQSEKEIPIQSDKVFLHVRVLEMYIDLVIRGLISFVVFGLFGYLVLTQIFHFPFHITLPIIFLCSIFSSPLLSKIKLGYKVQERYDDFLRKVIYFIKQHGTRK